MTHMMIIGVALVTLIVVLVLCGPGIGSWQDSTPARAAALLDERLARGEINEDEYRQLRTVLMSRIE